MAPVTNTRVIFVSYPDDYPVPNENFFIDRTESIDLENVPLNGGVLFKVLSLSVDPYQRGKMTKMSHYGSGYKLGEPIDNAGVARVLRSENPEMKQGDIIYSTFPFQEYVVQEKPPAYFRIIHNTAKIPLHTYVGMVGMPGKTAWYGWRRFFAERAKPGGIIFVSTAAGPVGSFVVQLAKKAGMKVIGSTGSDEKVEFLKSIGTDVPINYKKQDIRAILTKEGPIDMYWDHVGGEQLDAALENIKQYGIMVICGQITGYNKPHTPIKNFHQILFKQLTVNGYNVWQYEHLYAEEFYEEVPRLIANGEIKLAEHKYRGLEEAPKALRDVQTGDNQGKAVVIVSQED